MVITTTNAGEELLKQKPLPIAGENANKYNHYRKQYGDSSNS
jgi:hypothetical protein